MKINKTYKYRMYPSNNSTVEKMENIFRICNWTYNSAIGLKELEYKVNGISLSCNDIINRLKYLSGFNPTLSTVYSQVKQNVIRKVDHAYRLFFKGIESNRKVGKPKFKPYTNSITFPQANKGYSLQNESKTGIPVSGNWKWLKVNTGKEYLWFKVKYHREIEGNIKTCTIKKDKLGQWFVCFTVEQEIEAEEHSVRKVGNKIKTSKKIKKVGIDLGIKTLATLSDGSIVENPSKIDDSTHPFNKAIEKVKEAQRNLQLVRDEISELKKENKSTKGLYEKYKFRLFLLRKAWEYYENLCKDYLHKKSRKIVDNNDIILLEDFNPKDLMSKKENKSKSLRSLLQRSACVKFKNIIHSKAYISGKISKLVSPKGTTYKCCICNTTNAMKLENRTYRCSNCNNVMGRDYNSSINIRRKGLSLLVN